MNGQILLAVFLFILNGLFAYDNYRKNRIKLSFVFTICAIGELILIFLNLNLIKPWIN